MSRKSLSRWLTTVVAVGVLATALAAPAAAAPQSAPGQKSSALLPNEGKCDKKLAPIEVGLITGWDNPVLDLGDQVTAAEVSVDAFNNKRAGVGGHCIKLTTCNDGADPGKAVDCARQFASSNIVATINDTTSWASADVGKILNDAGIPRIGLSPATADLSASNTYTIGAGGAGTTFMMVPPLGRTGHKKVYLIGVDNPQIDALAAIMKPMVAANGMELVGLSKVPAGTTDYQQFVLAAERAGADSVIMPLDETLGTQVLNAAKQLGTKLDFSTSLGTFGPDSVKALGDFGKQIYFNAEIPPVAGDTKRWPILKTVQKDFNASGEDVLETNKVKTSPFRSWIATYHLKKIAEDYADPDNLTRASMTQAMNTAAAVDTFGLIPAWTPNKGVNPAPLGFTRISNPWYYWGTWDGKKFVLDKDQLNVADELAGRTTYAQPAS
jgi:ABC-type branched-subunit amino acid transport system substrate-binding protein